MKYMTFNSSCSYAGLANLLAFYDIDVSDRGIALDMGLPYLFTKDQEKYRFLNNKWENSDEPEILLLDEEELIKRLDDKVIVAVLERAAREEVDKGKFYEKSVEVLEQLRQDLVKFCSVERSAEELKNAMDTLFRAILLDGITMLELLGETEIRQKLKTVQGQLLAAIRENRAVCLDGALDFDLLQEGIREYCSLIREQAFLFR